MTSRASLSIQVVLLLTFLQLQGCSHSDGDDEPLTDTVANSQDLRTRVDNSRVDGVSQDEHTCSPNCTGLKCGTDGCGGTCGECPSGEICSAGKCAVDLSCGSITETGKCEGNTLKYCDNGQLQTSECVECGFDSYNQWYDCMGCNQAYPCIESGFADFDSEQHPCLGCGQFEGIVESCLDSYPCEVNDDNALYWTDTCKAFANWQYACAQRMASRGGGSSGIGAQCGKLDICE